MFTQYEDFTLIFYVVTVMLFCVIRQFCSIALKLNVNMQDGGGKTAFQIALESDFVDAAKMLLARGDLNAHSFRYIDEQVHIF